MFVGYTCNGLAGVFFKETQPPLQSVGSGSRNSFGNSGESHDFSIVASDFIALPSSSVLFFVFLLFCFCLKNKC